MKHILTWIRRARNSSENSSHVAFEEEEIGDESSDGESSDGENVTDTETTDMDLEHTSYTSTITDDGDDTATPSVPRLTVEPYQWMLLLGNMGLWCNDETTHCGFPFLVDLPSRYSLPFPASPGDLFCAASPAPGTQKAKPLPPSRASERRKRLGRRKFSSSSRPRPPRPLHPENGATRSSPLLDLFCVEPDIVARIVSGVVEDVNDDDDDDEMPSWRAAIGLVSLVVSCRAAAHLIGPHLMRYVGDRFATPTDSVGAVAWDRLPVREATFVTANVDDVETSGAVVGRTAALAHVALVVPGLLRAADAALSRAVLDGAWDRGAEFYEDTRAYRSISYRVHRTYCACMRVPPPWVARVWVALSGRLVDLLDRATRLGCSTGVAAWQRHMECGLPSWAPSLLALAPGGSHWTYRCPPTYPDLAPRPLFGGDVVPLVESEECYAAWRLKWMAAHAVAHGSRTGWPTAHVVAASIDVARRSHNYIATWLLLGGLVRLAADRLDATVLAMAEWACARAVAFHTFRLEQYVPGSVVAEDRGETLPAVAESFFHSVNLYRLMSLHGYALKDVLQDACLYCSRKTVHPWLALAVARQVIGTRASALLETSGEDVAERVDAFCTRLCQIVARAQVGGWRRKSAALPQVSPHLERIYPTLVKHGGWWSLHAKHHAAVVPCALHSLALVFEQRGLPPEEGATSLAMTAGSILRTGLVTLNHLESVRIEMAHTPFRDWAVARWLAAVSPAVALAFAVSGGPCVVLYALGTRPLYDQSTGGVAYPPVDPMSLVEDLGVEQTRALMALAKRHPDVFLLDVDRRWEMRQRPLWLRVRAAVQDWYWDDPFAVQLSLACAVICKCRGSALHFSRARWGLHVLPDWHY